MLETNPDLALALAMSCSHSQAVHGDWDCPTCGVRLPLGALMRLDFLARLQRDVLAECGLRNQNPRQEIQP